MGFNSHRALVAAACFVVAITVTGTGQARAQGAALFRLPANYERTVDPLVMRAKRLTDTIHHWYKTGNYPPAATYCRIIREAENTLDQLDDYVYGFDEYAIDAGDDLDDELDGEFWDGNYRLCFPKKYILGFPVWKSTRSIAGLYMGAHFTTNWAVQGIRDFDTLDGYSFDSYSESGDGVGGGFQMGYNFMPWPGMRRVGVGPYLEFNFLSQTIGHNYTGGTSVNAKINWSGTLGVKLSYQAGRGVTPYLVGGVTALNQTFSLTSSTDERSETKMVWGGTFGIGIEIKPWFLRKFGNNTLYLQYDYTAYKGVSVLEQGGTAFRFTRNDNEVKFGFNHYFDPANFPW